MFMYMCVCGKKIKVKVNCIMDIPHRKSIGTSRSMLPTKAMQRSWRKKLQNKIKHQTKKNAHPKCRWICTHNAIAVGQWICQKKNIKYIRNKIVCSGQHLRMVNSNSYCKQQPTTSWLAVVEKQSMQ